MKKCQFCAEEIQDEAVKCRYCNSMIAAETTPSAAPTALSAPSEGMSEATTTRTSRRFHTIMESDARLLDEGATVELDGDGRITGRAEAVLAEKRVTVVRLNARVKKCPFCSEEIQGEAVVCKHCGRNLRPAVVNRHKPGTKVGCPVCAKTITVGDETCAHCGTWLGAGPSPAPTKQKSTPGMPTCQHCGGSMQKSVVSSGNCAGIVVALIVFCAGILIVILIPVVGWVIGPLVCIGALFMGGKRRKVWKCKACGIVVDRKQRREEGGPFPDRLRGARISRGGAALPNDARGV